MDEMNDLVSVIIPFYSGKSWLSEAIESAINQTYSNLEIILINDGSIEEIDDIVYKYKDKIRYFYTENKGAASARNKGIRESNGKYIAFLDSDDLWRPTKITKQIQFLKDNKEVSWCICSYEIFEDLTKKVIKNVECSNYAGDVFPKIMYSSPIATPSVIVKKSILKNEEFRFEESLKFGEDSCLWIKLSLVSPLGCINEPLVSVRWRGGNAAANIVGQISSRSTVFESLKNFNPFEKNISKINKLAIIMIKYCKWLNYFVIKRKHISNQMILKIMYLPPRLYFKILSSII
ncbi:glycosyltransferase family 2 protein [Clostridiaceae bacterium OM02-2AC]|nr:glycosyltransferase family 2 protein [Clostridiaceae bacterium OM02-2AC]